LKRGFLASVVFAAALLAAVPAQALTADQIEVACPYDGTKFTAVVVMSMSQFGVNLDLKPHGALLAPIPLADCPTDGFVFHAGSPPSAEELEKARPFVFSPEYQAIREETPYFRYAFIAEKVGAPHAAVTYTLIMATWEAEEDPERYARYAAKVLARIDEDISATADEERETWLMLKGELLRRTSDFDAARTHFEAVLAELAPDAALRPIVEYQLKLIEEQDAVPHEVPSSE
jgi:hypothetical protein